MTLRQAGISAGILLVVGLGGYGFGRYATPAKVVTVTKTEIKTEVQWKDRIVEKIVSGPTRTVTRTIERPVACVPGETTPSVDTTTTVDAGPVVIDRVDTGEGSGTTDAKTEIIKTVIQEQPRFMLQAGTSVGFKLNPEIHWNAGGSYRFIGPVWLGVYYRSEKELEARFGFTF